MLKSSESNHEHYEELCALAALGQISEEEYAELLPHLHSCASCRVRHSEFMEILHEHLPLLDPQKELFADSPNISFHYSSYKQRFIRRAREQGIEFTDFDSRTPAADRAPQRPQRWIRELFWPPSVQSYAFLLTLIVLGWTVGWMAQKSRDAHLRPTDSLTETVRLKGEIASLQQKVHQLSESNFPPQLERATPQLNIAPRTQVSDLKSLQAELAVANHNYSVQLAKSRSLEEQLQKTSSGLTSLRAELASLQSKAQGIDKLHDTELALRQAVDELEKLRRARASDMTALAAQQVQLTELAERLNSQNDSLDRERELLVAGRDIRDLMGARSLHIIDVSDVDSQGTKRPFGRVFYTEGKSLIFYAYDLERKKKPQERYSFQAWGQRESKSSSVQSLGIFFVDDQAQNRWILKYDDPSVLAEIDAVFVTLEPKGGSPKPKGQQLMYAYLKASPNHP